MDKTDSPQSTPRSDTPLSHLSSESAELFRRMTAPGARRPLRSLTPLYADEETGSEAEPTSETESNPFSQRKNLLITPVDTAEESSRETPNVASPAVSATTPDAASNRTPKEVSSATAEHRIRHFSLSSVDRDQFTAGERHRLIPFPDLTEDNTPRSETPVTSSPPRPAESFTEPTRHESEPVPPSVEPGEEIALPRQGKSSNASFAEPRLTLYGGPEGELPPERRPFTVSEDDFAPSLPDEPSGESAGIRPEPIGETLMEVTDLRKGYVKGKTLIPVLRGINVRVRDGEFLSVVGQSGSGKSTLLHLMGTLDTPDSGMVHFDGQRIDNLPIRQRDHLRNRYIGMIFQSYHLIPEMTMIENVLAPLMIRESLFGYFRRRHGYIERAKELLDLVGLSHRIHHKPCELSGGEMQRTSIARALITDPRVLLADEPTGNLDSKTTVEIIKLLRSLNIDKKLTIIMVTHDLDQARDADRVIRLVDGQVVDNFRIC